MSNKMPDKQGQAKKHASGIIDAGQETNVALASAEGGVIGAVQLGAITGCANVLKQARAGKEGGFIKKTFSKMPPEFEFKSKSFKKWAAVGAGVGLLEGAVTYAVGAVHANRDISSHNDEVIDKMKYWAEKHEAEKAAATTAPSVPGK